MSLNYEDNTITVEGTYEIVENRLTFHVTTLGVKMDGYYIKTVTD